MKINYKKHRRTLVAATAAVLMLFCPVQAATAGEFDPFFYASTYPDVAAAYGTDIYALYNHYITLGQQEGRIPYSGAAAGEDVSGIIGMMSVPETGSAAVSQTPATGYTSDSGRIVPIGELQNYASLKKKMTDGEFQMAYDAALNIVQPLAGLSREEQMTGIMSALRNMVDNGQVSYSTSPPHYNDAYGYLINHVASCAGSTRTTGLCLNMLGIPYEHVHENQWCHQWCRADVDGTLWIVDPYAYTCMIETRPYEHPLADCGS